MFLWFSSNRAESNSGRHADSSLYVMKMQTTEAAASFEPVWHGELPWSRPNTSSPKDPRFAKAPNHGHPADEFSPRSGGKNHFLRNRALGKIKIERINIGEVAIYGRDQRAVRREGDKGNALRAIPKKRFERRGKLYFAVAL
jgi:hypothetical protein